MLKYTAILNKRGQDPLRWIWVLLSLTLLFALVGCSASPDRNITFAPIGEDTVPAGDVINNDVLLTGTNVVVEGKVEGDVWAIGNNVTVNGPVTGSVIALGQEVTVNSEIGGSLYSAAGRLELGPTSVISNNAHFIGLFLDTQSGSVVGRDLVVASLRAVLSADVGRSLNGFVLLMTLNGRIGLPEEGGEPVPTPTEENSTSLPGARLFGNNRLFIGSSGTYPIDAMVPRHIHQLTSPAEPVSVQESDVAEVMPNWLYKHLVELAILLPLGLIMLWIFPSVIKRSAHGLRSKPLPATGYGLLGAVVAVNVVAIAILLFVTLLMFGIWLGTVFSWKLTFIAWGVGYPALALTFALFYLSVLYISKVVVFDLVGTFIFGKVAPKTLKFRVLPFLLGILIYILLRAIPVFGLGLDVVIIILGLGGMWVAFRDRGETAVIDEKDDEGEVEETEGEEPDEPTGK